MTQVSDLPAESQAALEALRRDLTGVMPQNAVPSTPKPPRESPVTVHVKRLSEQYGEELFTASEVAERCGVSVQAIRKYADRQVCGEGVAPSLKTYLGEMKINLFTASDIAALQNFLAARFQVHSTKGGE